MIRARIFAICCGYEDADDLDTLRTDPAFKLACRLMIGPTGALRVMLATRPVDFRMQGGIGAHPDEVMHMRCTADRLFGDSCLWSVLGAGRNQMPVATMAAAMGANVRVGLEDSLWIGPGRYAKTNAEQVSRIRGILEGLGLEIATPDEARELLELKGGDKVGF